MNSPYKLVDSKETYRADLFRVRTDTVEGPHDKRFRFSVIEMKPGSSILPLSEDGQVYLIQEFKYAISRTSTEVASGAMERNEKPLAAAQRELREEVGLKASEWIHLGSIDPFTTQLVSPNHMFLALGIEKVPREPDEAEVIKVVKMPFLQAVDMVMRGEITHAPTCVLILKAKEWLAERARRVAADL
jgi:ADP-ribose pyrophosphatase